MLGEVHAGECRHGEVRAVGGDLPSAVAAADLTFALAHPGRRCARRAGRRPWRSSSSADQRSIHAAVSSTPRVHPASSTRPDSSTATTPVSFGARRPRPHARSMPRTRTRSIEGVLGDEVGGAVEGAQRVVVARRRHSDRAARESHVGVAVDDRRRRPGSRTRRARSSPGRDPPPRRRGADRRACSAMLRRPWIGIQPSQYSTTWRNVTGPPAPPMMIGGCGSLTGFGQLHDGENCTCSPSKEASSSVHSARMARTCSRAIARRSAGSTPWCSISSTFHPTPMPTSTRPPERRSSEAIVLASTIGSCWATSVMPVPRRSRSVTPAAAVRATYGSSVRRYSSGSSGPPGHGVRRLVGMCVCSVTHSDSNPRPSSSTARRSGRIDRSVGKINAPIRMSGTVRAHVGCISMWRPNGTAVIGRAGREARPPPG